MTIAISRELTRLSLIVSVLTHATIAIAGQSPAQAFNFTTGDVGGNCENLITAFAPYSQLGQQPLSTCETADGLRLIAEGGDLQARRDGSIMSVGVTDMDWSNMGGVCITGVISPCNGNTGEGEIGHWEALYVLLPDGSATLESLDLAFRFGWDTPVSVAFEIAALLTDHSQTTGTLTFTDKGAIWNWAGTTQTTTFSNTGYRLIQPFGNHEIAALKLTAPNLSNEYGYVDTKYGLVGAEAKQTAAVPEPSTIAGVTLASGLAVLKRKIKR
ncbi:PEP-CTERM sorting domain-containing protein [Pantanalinema rosaneae CENA516]|uniref:PEP-CTERM sorting domain-containing protein n=1 Tax=Pantanalinema rosaneae TaxID=1620701 RepID=UPI003D6FC287